MSKSKAHIKQLLLYFGIAGISAAINFVSRFGYDIFLGDGASVIAAYCTGMLLNFGLSRRFVFKPEENAHTMRQFIKFSGVSMIGLGVTYVTFLMALNLFTQMYAASFSEQILKSGAHIVAMGFGFLANFFGHKFISFKSTGLGDKLSNR